MQNKITGLLSAVAALGALGTAQATPAPDPNEVLKANSFAELLEPIPNAIALLKVVEESQAKPAEEGNVQLAQYYRHHHHHHFWRRYRHHHHHHHHHHHGYYRYY
ncbi:MAG TPA: hypothetical protein VKT76_09925 [Bradyrhizobium sp.]|nr:hypothetical protein [Bradyrhizobium sp.]